MDITQLTILFILGLVGGVLAGLIGVGGGVFFVPALMFMGWGITEAVAASLVIIIFSSLSGTLRSYRSGNPIDKRAAMLLSLTVSPSALIGVAISRLAPDYIVEAVFALLLLALAYPTARGSVGAMDAKVEIPTLLVIGAGICIGALSGLVGVGGGILMVPLMILGLNLRPKVAIATSLAVAFFTGVVGAAGYVATGFREFSSLPLLVAGSILGAWLSVRVRNWAPDAALRIGFGIYMVFVAIYLLLGLGDWTEHFELDLPLTRVPPEPGMASGTLPHEQYERFGDV
ncbi:sulfite exporter TauE/SafE family protein [Rubrobacter taiwanensis]|jgi:uncharacterized membrane protein YfcA|uniref:Probable membrane transporter protein n=1 Tax=Rubrobacter taiwanensis TaxID=185139 RepID=A0A4R1BQM7_9ACTN|nr:sulfite exporter TauE/SafE family protein [Rubrobacter taiwanensis]TCJ19878.1 sulfite exporter TauE/SafE family protein [Rubrobacter taiwanensis]